MLLQPLPHLPRRRPHPRRAPALPLFLSLLLPGGCGREVAGSARWAGTMDTLPTGLVVVTNPAEGMWDSSTAWRVVEELRIGTVDEVGPTLFGEISAVEVDAAGRLWVLEGQALELRVFDHDGRHLRTIGRKGGGPGEFAQPIGMAWSPAGDLWIPDPQNTRISVVDTAGRFVRSHRMLGGFVIMPWPGGFDRGGSFYNIAPGRTPDGEFTDRLVRYDTALTPLDTLTPPKWTGPQEYFELSDDRGGRMMTSVPYTPGLDWALTPDGDFWFALTGPYELYRVTAAGDTVRKVTKPFAPVAVTGADVDSALTRLEWFTKQGGKVDRSRIPSVKPAVRQFLVADDGYLWVEPTGAHEGDRGRVFEVFDPDGRYLGRVRLPFGMAYPLPVIRGDLMVAVTRDELEVPYVVRARIVKP